MLVQILRHKQYTTIPDPDICSIDSIDILVQILKHRKSAWLCIDCGRCTNSCSQLVDGRQLRNQVKELAALWGVLDIDFKLRVEHANQVIYKYFLNEIDQLFGL